MKKVLILCTGNSCRSQIAEGYFKHFAGERAFIASAGIEAHGLNPRAVQVMLHDGIDISRQKSELVDGYLKETFDFVITVCDHANEVCPIFPSKTKQIHHNFPDPAKAIGTETEIMNAFKSVRDEIKSFAKSFVEQNL